MFLAAGFRGQNEWWQYLLTIVLIIILAMIFTVPFALVAMAIATKNGLDPFEATQALQTMDFAALGLNSAVGLSLLILQFVGMILALWIGVKFLHKKRFVDLIQPLGKVKWGRIGFGFLIWFLIALAFELAFLPFGEDADYVFQWKSGAWFQVLIVCIFLLPLQTSAEELIFRGYFMQGLGVLVKNRWLPLLITSVAFGLMHLANPEIKEYGLASSMSVYIGIGLLMGIMTLMSGGLELALGVHFANNFFAATIVGYEGSAIKTPALIIHQNMDMTWAVVGVIVSGGIFLAICAWKYGWTDWQDKLTGRVEKPVAEVTDFQEV